jgi:hypothetical protein
MTKVETSLPDWYPPMANVISFEDALKSAGEKPRSLLLANGFSIAYFHYGTLLDNAGFQNTDPLRRLSLNSD